MNIKSGIFLTVVAMNVLALGASSSASHKEWYALHTAGDKSIKVVCCRLHPDALRGIQLDLCEPTGISDSLELKGNTLSIEGRPVLNKISLHVAGGVPKHIAQDEDRQYYEPARFLLVQRSLLLVLNHSAFIGRCSMEAAAAKMCAGQKDIQQLKDPFAVVSHIEQTMELPTLVIDLEAYLEQSFGNDWRNKLPIKRVPVESASFPWNIWRMIARSEPHADLTKADLRDRESEKEALATCAVQ